MSQPPPQPPGGPAARCSASTAARRATGRAGPGATGTPRRGFEARAAGMSTDADDDG